MSEQLNYKLEAGDTYSAGCYDGGDTMTEKDKMIQDLRMDNDKLHVLIRQYIEGVKNLTEENKQLRMEVAELKEKVAIMEKTVAETRDVSDFVM